MLIEVAKRNGKLAEGIRQLIEQRMQSALGGFSQRIRRVSVILSDVTGNGGDTNKQCRLRIALIPSGEVVVEEIDASVATALAKVAERAARSVSRALERRPDFSVVPERVIFTEPRRCRIDSKSVRRQPAAWSGWVDRMVFNPFADRGLNLMPARFEIGSCESDRETTSVTGCLAKSCDLNRILNSTRVFDTQSSEETR